MEYLSSNCQDMLWERSIITVEDVTTCIQSMRIDSGDTHEGAGEEQGRIIECAGKIHRGSWILFL